MKKIKAGFAAVAVLVFAVCSISPVPEEKNLSNTVLTGQVVQVEDTVMTLDLGELTWLQTPETAAYEVRSHEGVPLNGMNSQQAAQNTAAQTFVSWEQGAVLDLSGAQVFTVTAGQAEPAVLQDVLPQDIVSVAVDSDNLAAVVTILASDEQERAEPEALQGTAANTIKEDHSERGAEYRSVSDDENALRVASATVNLRNVRVGKSDGITSNSYGSSHYGLNATLLATGGAQLTLSNGIVNSSASSGNGVFSHGAGTMVYLNGGAVTTTGDGAGGVQTAGGAGVYAKGATIITAGDAAAVIRACSGGSGVQLGGGTYTSGGYESPVIYAAGAVNARNAAFTANNSQAVVVEGSGSAVLEKCDVTGKMSVTQADEEVCTVAIFSHVELPENKQGRFSMSGGSLTSRSGDIFHVTDAVCTIELKNVTVNNEGEGALLRVVSEDESRAASVSLTAQKQKLSGNILVDSTSALQLELTDGSRYTGAVQRTDQRTETSGDITVHVSRGCTWSLTGNSVVDTLDNEGTIQYNGYSITLADGTVLTA